jgi:imidazolonepropionase-like amidohydrolase
VAGQRFQVRPLPGDDLRGTYDLNLRSVILKMVVKGEREKPEVIITRPAADSIKVKGDLSRQGDLVTLLFNGGKVGIPGSVRLNGIVHRDAGLWDGQGLLPSDEWIPWSAVKQKTPGVITDEKKKDKEKNALDSLWSLPPGEVWAPFGAYGSATPHDTGTVIFRHATVWTNGAQGILRDADVMIYQGKIKAVGQGLAMGELFPAGKPPCEEIDATGLHLTSGIIDEHSHIAIERGVNEWGQAISAEVRVGDVIDPDDVDIYRDLAGGVTAVQQLHGSSNPIGGQSSLIKLRWGSAPEKMKIAGADGFIKFALGENVKGGNGPGGTAFPQTRMGVEQIMFDAFHRAREYDHEQRAYAALKPKDKTSAAPPRRDLELDALAEILDGTRFITCHSYVQSEILMLMRLADSLGFKVNTFTHILEGYKVAQKMKEHGVSASTFSDWWAYKFEVYDAIPYNAALLTRAGVNTCINSDDAEMSRRLNQEAAKTVKYGGMSEEEAWKMVTLNPAKALHLDAHMGSVEVGKDADLVLWSADPLGIDAKVEMTFVDGMRLFDQDRDRELRTAMRAERERIIQKMLVAKRSGASDAKGRPAREARIPL